MYKRIYQKFIEPQSKDPDTYSRQLVLNWLMVGIIIFTLFTIINSFISLVFLREHYVWLRFTFIVLLAVAWVALYAFSRRKATGQLIAKFCIVGSFLIFASFILYRWGPINPTGIVLFGLVIVMAGILLGARYSLYAAVGISAILFGVEFANLQGWIHPDIQWMRRTPSMGDMAVYSSIFAVLALISWLFNRQMEMSLKRARKSEAGLKRQKALLEIKVEERTRQLQAAQLEKMQQFYRFAELGHLSTALFHDLANHLMSVGLDIESLKKRRRTDIVNRIQDSIGYIDSVVQNVRQQIQAKPTAETFEVIPEVKNVMNVLSFQAKKARVNIELDAPAKGRLLYKGDLTRFRQLITNLVSNAIESYRNSSNRQGQKVVLGLKKTGNNIVIRVSDHGAGISPQLQKKIFEPFFSTKQKGIGIGLFIVKKVVEEDFQGQISLVSDKQNGTIFTVTLPVGPSGRRTVR